MLDLEGKLYHFLSERRSDFGGRGHVLHVQTACMSRCMNMEAAGEINTNTLFFFFFFISTLDWKSDQVHCTSKAVNLQIWVSVNSVFSSFIPECTSVSKSFVIVHQFHHLSDRLTHGLKVKCSNFVHTLLLGNKTDIFTHVNWLNKWYKYTWKKNSMRGVFGNSKIQLVLLHHCTD